ncbi:GTPase-associated protein 1-related protein [Actinokineospora enzanensis]|uniref:GTPase-associated protein 1-related protein n=1 Tax=Actinokineospora enzanensis TaxID=155975 RepID=UPI00037476D8|nr:GTPase-associated protein 1-related protein [Actinokineospora enzanensis]
MSEPGFRSLYYTDCAPGQGLRGGAGFQFQAVSAGVDHETMTLVQRTSLYEAPVAWMREQRPAEQYPPSLTHLSADGCLVTARGIYLGAEANGAREGNQFTHAVSTTDPEAYGQIRPAQLWQAPWWVERPAPSTVCDAVAAEPEPGPWGVDAVREWVLGTPGGEEWLTAVVSVFDRLDGPDRRRVLFIAEDANAVLGWITAGTLLLPQRRAVRIGFRVFATNPRYTAQDVLAVHPDWAGPYAGGDGEFVVFDLARGNLPAVEPTPAAAHWVPRFLHRDPYDVVDAVEMAHDYTLAAIASAAPETSVADGTSDALPAAEAAVPVDDVADRLVAGAVVLGEEVDAREAGTLAAWLGRHPGLSVDDVVDPVARTVLAAEADVAVLRDLDAALVAYPGSTLGGATRMALLRAEITAVLAGGTSQAPPQRAWFHGGAKAGAGLLESTLDTAAPDRVAPLLGLATDFRLTPAVPNYRDGLHRFARWWVDHPETRLDPARWPESGAVLDQVRDELGYRLDRADAAGLPEVVDEIRTHWGRVLRGTDPTTALDAYLLAAALDADPPSRHRIVRMVLDAVRALPADDVVRAAWRALFSYATPTPEELADLLTACPGRVRDPERTRMLRAVEPALRRQVTAVPLDVLRRLAERAEPGLDGWLYDLYEQDTRLCRWMAAPEQRTTGPEPGADLREIGTGVLAARRDVLVPTLTRRLPFDLAGHVVGTAGPRLAEVLSDRLPSLWRHEAGRRQERKLVALGMLCYLAGMPTAPTTALDKDLTGWLRAAEPDEIRDVSSLLHTVDPRRSQAWSRYIEEVAPRKFKQLRQTATRRAKDPDRPKGTAWPSALLSRLPFGKRER